MLLYCRKLQQIAPVPEREVITLTMDRDSKELKVQHEKPTNVKSVFNIKPPVGSLTGSSKASNPSPQDIKDGHARLRPMPKFLYTVC